MCAGLWSREAAGKVLQAPSKYYTANVLFGVMGLEEGPLGAIRASFQGPAKDTLHYKLQGNRGWP